MEEQFKSKVDAWLVILLVAPTVCVVTVRSGVFGGSSHFSVVRLAVLALPLAVMAGLALRFFRSTSYTISPDNLTVRFGPTTRIVPLRSITRVAVSRSLGSAPALSLDRLAIEYGMGQVVVISPQDKPRFLEALAQSGVAVNLTLVPGTAT